jgi:hypothetical protein
VYLSTSAGGGGQTKFDPPRRPGALRARCEPPRTPDSPAALVIQQCALGSYSGTRGAPGVINTVSKDANR